MRWVLVIEPDGMAKASLVILGYTHHDLANLKTTSPTASRRARSLLLTLAAQHGWSFQKGDVTAAFLQGRATEEGRGVYVNPPKEVRKILNMQDDETLLWVKSGYGTVHAPRCWWEAVTLDMMHKAKLKSMLLEPCLYAAYSTKMGLIIGAVLVHVDDFVFAGDEGNPEGMAKIAIIRGLYLCGDWHISEITQCGVRIVPNDKWSSTYSEELAEFPIHKYRRCKATETATDKEKGLMLEATGSVQWTATQWMVHLSSKMSQVQSSIPTTTVADLHECNNMTRMLKEFRHDGIQLFKPTGELQFVCWHETA